MDADIRYSLARGITPNENDVKRLAESIHTILQDAYALRTRVAVPDQIRLWDAVILAANLIAEIAAVERNAEVIERAPLQPPA